MRGDYVSKHTELNTDFIKRSEILGQRPAHAKVPDDIRTKTGPYFGMTVPPVAERRERPRSESTYDRLTSAVFEV
jgi:hypothetical protein